MDGRRQGRPEEELFLRPAAEAPDTPTVGPLRINKIESASATTPPRAGSAGSATEGGFSRPPPMPTFPVPPTSPPTAPLPYPDDRNRQQVLPRTAYTPLSERDRIAKNSTPP